MKKEITMPSSKQANTLKKFISPENQMALRERFFAILRKSPKPYTKMVKKMEINTATLISFLVKEKDVDYIRLLKIEKYIESFEYTSLEKELKKYRSEE